MCVSASGSEISLAGLISPLNPDFKAFFWILLPSALHNSLFLFFRPECVF